MVIDQVLQDGVTDTTPSWYQTLMVLGLSTFKLVFGKHLLKSTGNIFESYLCNSLKKKVAQLCGRCGNFYT